MEFYIGHPAYKSPNPNSFETAHNKSEAIKVLRERGVTRDVARNTLKKAEKGEWTFCSPNLSTEIIEVLIRKDLK
jgi:hypothetical protein